MSSTQSTPADLSSHAAQAQHYADVRARLSGKKPTARALPAAPAPSPAHHAPAFTMAPRARQRDIIYVSPMPTPALEPMPIWKQIMFAVAEKHGVTMEDLQSIRRDQKSVNARYEVFYRMRLETSMSLPQIGRRCGRKDHTTVLHGIRKHMAFLAGGGGP